MKKLILICLFMLIASQAWADEVGTIVVVSDITMRSGEGYTRVVEYSIGFGADATGAAFADVALNSITGSASLGVGDPSLAGWWLFKIESFYVATVVTADSDLYLWSYASDGLDVLGGNGVNKVDADTNFTIYPATSTQPLTGSELIDIDNSAVNGASHTIRIHLYK